MRNGLYALTADGFLEKCWNKPRFQMGESMRSLSQNL